LNDADADAEYDADLDSMTRRLLLNEFTAAFAVVLLGGLLRLWALGDNPPGIFRDEAEKALNGWAIADRGAAFEFVQGIGGGPAVNWRSWPLFIGVNGVKTSAIYQYALALFVGGGRPSALLTRLPAAFAGIASVIALFALARLLYGAPVALCAAFWLAVSPWSVAFSRWALQGSFIPLFMTLGVGGLAMGMRRRPVWLLLGGSALGLAFYTYSGARPFLLAFAAVSALILWKRLSERREKRRAIGALALFLVFAAPTLAMMLAPGGMSRFGAISVFGGDGGFMQAIGSMISNYFSHFSPSFLIVRGDLNLRHGVDSFGELYHVEFVFALLGIWRLAKDRPPELPLLAAWLVLFPVGAMLTNPAEMPHALRTIVALPLPQLLAAHGMVWFASRAKAAPDGAETSLGSPRRTRIAYAAAGLFVFLSVAAFSYDLFVRYPDYSARQWETGFGEALAGARREAEPGAPVYISGSIAMSWYLTMYYDSVSPGELAKQGWGALNAIHLPPQPAFDLSAHWDSLPKGAALVALDPGIDRIYGYVFPVKIVHPPAATIARREALTPLYVVYKKN
jgi:4-amino-4-deoxy-L-arabinose transferase-like glycosyltransferase